MPDVLIVNDDASFASSDTFSTRDSIEQPQHSLRRRNTVSQLTRRVSKRISQTILGAGVQEHQLSEKNLKNLNYTTNVDSHNLRSPAHQVPDIKLHDAIHEEIEDECPAFDVKAAREMRLRQSYAAFCENFTLSGTTATSRKFDLSMGMEWVDEHTQSSHTDRTPEDNDMSGLSVSANPEHITVLSRPRPGAVAFPISHPSADLDKTPISHSETAERSSSESLATETSEVKKNFHITPNSNYLRPPPHIITPTVWMDMQRDERERKASRRQRLLNPLRSWFLASQPSWGRRYDVVE